MSSFKLVLITVLMIFSMVGCISNLLKEPAPTFSDQIILPNLPLEFVAQNTSTYPSWKNKSNSTVISVVSECTTSNGNQVASLKSAHSLITNAIENELVIEEKKMTIKNKASYFRKISGLVDGYPLEVLSASFVFENCVYVSSLSGTHEKINLDLNTWTNFNQNIEFKK